jgi:hypothetical protein
MTNADLSAIIQQHEQAQIAIDHALAQSISLAMEGAAVQRRNARGNLYKQLSAFCREESPLPKTADATPPDSTD